MNRISPGFRQELEQKLKSKHDLSETTRKMEAIFPELSAQFSKHAALFVSDSIFEPMKEFSAACFLVKESLENLAVEPPPLENVVSAQEKLARALTAKNALGDVELLLQFMVTKAHTAHRIRSLIGRLRQFSPLTVRQVSALRFYLVDPAILSNLEEFLQVAEAFVPMTGEEREKNGYLLKEGAYLSLFLQFQNEKSLLELLREIQNISINEILH